MSYQLHHGDCLEVMRGLPADSIDSIVTDPPYGLGFMGKEWDALPPGEEWASECLRVLKPGGHLLAFGGTRTWHRLAVAVEDAGFEIRDSIAWMYGSGFPKHRTALKPAFEPIVMARSPFRGALTTNEAQHGTGALNIETCRIGAESRRWPANVILDESTAPLLDEQAGTLSRGRFPATQSAHEASSYSVASGRIQPQRDMDAGGASKFFYVAKAPKKERPIVDGVAHPTVKPLALMRWLCKLVTPEGGIVLDPFAGSGTTIEAALQEGFRAIGIEREAEYLPLIQARIDRGNAA